MTAVPRRVLRGAATPVIETTGMTLPAADLSSRRSYLLLEAQTPPLLFVESASLVPAVSKFVTQTEPTDDLHCTVTTT